MEGVGKGFFGGELGAGCAVRVGGGVDAGDGGWVVGWGGDVIGL